MARRPVVARGGRPGGGATRAEVIERLEREALLPAITFIFSRVGCEAAVGQLLAPDSGSSPRPRASATGGSSRSGVRASPRRTSRSSATGTSSTGSPAGIAAHHAGMLPTFREIVEELFTAGRIRAVFATETLALGINMPARTVVLEKLVKFNGEAHVDVTPGGVHPADRAGRPARHRHRRSRRRPLEPWARPAGRGRARVDADLPAAVELPADLQHGRQPRAPSSAATGPGSCWRRRSPSSRPTGPWWGSSGRSGATRRPWPGTPRRCTCDRGDFAAYAAIRDEIRRVEKDAVKRRAASVRARGGGEPGEAAGR